MTPPIPLGGERKRPSKSCLPCRQAKAKCTGLSEAYLHDVDNDPTFVPDPDIKCNRCLKQHHECTFAPSRRKGRPRRVAPASNSQSHSVSPSASPSRDPDGSDFNPNLTTADFDATRSPSSSTNAAPSPSTTASVSGSCETLPAPALEAVVEGYLNEIYIWCPILPNDAYKLRNYLAHADPNLTLALASVLDTSRPPPAFPPTTSYIQLSTLQAAVILSLRAYGVKDRTTAVELIEWVSNEFRALGWKGHDLSKLSPEILRTEIESFIGLGYMVYGLTIQLGVLTGNRSLLLAQIQLPPDVSFCSYRPCPLLRNSFFAARRSRRKT